MLNIIFIIVVAFGFLFIWIPFLLNVNKTFIKIKNINLIIPSELLTTLFENLYLNIYKIKIDLNKKNKII